jgi:diketogulonate reductase-like aldo/keto reductase
MKKLISVMVLICLLLSLSACGDAATTDASVNSSEANKPNFIWGDADGNGELDIIDATVIQRYLVGLPTSAPINMQAAIVSGDDELSIIDATWIQRKLASIIDKFPVETEQEESKMILLINETPIEVNWEDNEAVAALCEAVKENPLMIRMSMYGGFEQVGSLGMSLPQSDTRITTEVGDIVLYAGDQMVVFYGSNTWEYTRLGHITDKTQAELTELLSNGDVIITVKMNDTQTEDYSIPDKRLNSGYTMPALGLGTWTQDDDTAEESVYTALKDGYRLIDMAQYYGNETGVGRGIKRAIDDGIVTREEVFITTKVMPSNYDRAYQSIDESLNRLGLSYIDLMLIHQSGSNDVQVYKALCQGVKDGKLRSIGISNYYTADEFERVTAGSDIKPAVVQNENHIYYQNTELQEYVAQYGTIVESWYPFGGRGHTSENFNNETIVAIAQAHNKTSAQIILRWQLQAGYIAIPGSSNPDHILENISIFDFELTEDEMRQIAGINQNQRYENW